MANPNVAITVPTSVGQTGTPEDISGIAIRGRHLFVALAAKADVVLLEGSPDGSRYFPVITLRGRSPLSFVEAFPPGPRGEPVPIKYVRAKRLAGTGAVTVSIAGDSPNAVDARHRRESIVVVLDADAEATTTIAKRVVFTAEEACKVSSAKIVPAGALTAHDANYLSVLLTRRDAAGGNEAAVATLDTRTTSGSWTAFVPKSLGALTNTSLAAGESLVLEQTKAALGVSAPIRTLHFRVEIDP